MNTRKSILVILGVFVLVMVAMFGVRIGFSGIAFAKEPINNGLSFVSSQIDKIIPPGKPPVPENLAPPVIDPAPSSDGATPIPEASQAAQAVPTLQVPWTPVPGFVAQADGQIDWDHLALMPEWEEGHGLAPNVRVLYLQSGVPNSLTLPGLPFTIPTGQHLIFGALNATLSIQDTGGTVDTYAFGSGFYVAIPGGTTVTNLRISDGFGLLVNDVNALDEFCYRVAQAYAEGWAHDHVYHSPSWSAPVCPGIYSVPLDSDR